MFRATLRSDPHATIDRNATNYEAETADAALNLALTEAQTRWGNVVSISEDEILRCYDDPAGGLSYEVVGWVEPMV